MLQPRFLRPFVLALLAALAFAAAPAAAQEAQDTPPVPAPAPESFSDEKLEAFADAAAEVQGVMDEARPRIAEAESEEEGRRLVEEVNRDIRTTIESQPDITFDEYRRIAMRAGQDPGFKQRLDTLVQDAIRRKAEE